MSSEDDDEDKAKKKDDTSEEGEEEKEKPEPKPSPKTAPAPAPPAGMSSTNKLLLGVGALALVAVVYRMASSAPSSPTTAPSAEPSGATPPTSPSGSESSTPPSTTPLLPGFSAPIAAANLAGGDVLVAGLEAQTKAIVLQRINSKDEVVARSIVLSDVAGSTDSELKLIAESATGGAAFITWRGLRGGKLVRQLVTLGNDLKPKGEPTEVASASCATREGAWFSDGSKANSRPWSGPTLKVDLPKEKDASLLCGQHRAFAILEEDERTSVLPLGGTTPDASAPPAHGPVTMMRESDFEDDEQRELSEYTVGDDVGFVRLAASGAIAIRELPSGNASPSALKKLKTHVKRDDDVVAVEASPKEVVIVFTQDVSDAAGDADTQVCTKINALRVDRTTFEETVLELSPGRCGFEVGPFWTSPLGDNVSLAWTERASAASQGKPRAPIVAVAHVVVEPTGKPTLARVDQAAEAIVDAGCTPEGCFAAALTRSSATDKGVVKILRYK